MSGKEWWRPEIFASRKNNLAIRAKAVAATRAFFAARSAMDLPAE